MSEYPRKDRAERTLSWYMCHNCGKEFRIADGVRNSRGCDNCWNPNVHIHSNVDGELPTTLPLPDWMKS